MIVMYSEQIKKMLKIEDASGVTVELFVSKSDVPHSLELTYENKLADTIIRPFITRLKANVSTFDIIDTLSDINSQYHITKNKFCDLGEMAEQVCTALKEAKISFKAIVTYATVNYTLNRTEVTHISRETIQDVIGKNAPLDIKDQSEVNWNANMYKWLK